MRRLVVLAVLCCAGVVHAHVAPSVDDNNRYVKLTPLGDRVRLAYTVFFGQVPGAGLRRDLDANHDGTISDDESNAFGAKLAAEVADGLVVEIDGTPQPVTWTQVVVGMGTPQTAAGAFSVDLVASLCLPSLRGAHHVVLRDRFKLTRPGETELKLEDAPGVKVDRANLGGSDTPDHDVKLLGPGGQLSDPGIDVSFTAGPTAPVTADATCAAPRGARGMWWLYSAFAGALVAVALVLVGRRRSVE
ncbi:MAG TPA: hypothetical protein VGM88_17065 [Kofleriaceae bacterium]